jgi:hypothetical protein
MAVTEDIILLSGKNMKFYLVIFFFIFLNEGCFTIINKITLDKRLWEDEKSIVLRDTILKYSFNIKGYYKPKNEISENFFFFEDGYVARTSDTFLTKDSRYLEWGKFLIEKDSITIKYFSPDVLHYIPLIYTDIVYTVNSEKGRIVDDSTFQIYKTQWYQTGDKYPRQQIFNPPITFKFIKTVKPDSRLNWLKKRLKEE